MADGILKGSGTQTDPWLVEDAWDLHALRDLPLSWQWIKIENDINLSAFPNWTPIPDVRQFNIDGNNKEIRNLRMTGTATASAHMGLFHWLETQETKDLIIEGDINCTGTGTNPAGMLAGRIACNGAGKVSNIQCFGSVTGVFTGATGSVGGVFGDYWGESNVSASIENCAFYGSITHSISNSSTTVPGAAQYRTCGGIFGDITSRSGITDHSVVIRNCISVCQFVLVSGNAHSIIGGISGGSRNAVGSRLIDGCIAKVKLRITNSGNYTQPVWFGGIVGSQIENTSVENCAAFCDIEYDPVGTLTQLNVGGIQGNRPSSTNVVRNCYAVISFDNPNDTPLPTVNMRGIAHNGEIINSFFDAGVLAKGWSGDVIGETWGRTTQQLQSRQFLESQGWVFADV